VTVVELDTGRGFQPTQQERFERTGYRGSLFGGFSAARPMLVNRVRSAGWQKA